jgi:hypothetical protein
MILEFAVLNALIVSTVGPVLAVLRSRIMFHMLKGPLLADFVTEVGCREPLSVVRRVRDPVHWKF